MSGVIGWNSILGGTAALTSSGALLLLAGYAMRELPARMGAVVRDLATLSLTVKDDDAAFVWVKEWFLEQRFARRMRRVDLDTSLQGRETALLPAPGSHLFWRGRRLFEVTLYRSHEGRDHGRRRMESLVFRTVGRDPGVLQRLVTDICTVHRRLVADQPRLYIYDDGWDWVAGYLPRSLDSVLLPPGEKERLVADIAWFLAGREHYVRLGLPYHRGYLFHGPPGTGKTSLVSAVAAHFGLAIYFLNLAELNDRSLKTAVRDVPLRSLLLFEDIDAMVEAVHHRGNVAELTPRAPAAAGVTLAGLLNVLDGFHAPQGVVYAMTTNVAAKLDAALLRPGRVDYRLELTEAGEAQKVALYGRFFPGASSGEALRFAQLHRGATMAEAQGSLLAAGPQPGAAGPV